MDENKIKCINVDEEVYVYNNVIKQVCKGIVKRVTIVLQDEMIDITYHVLIPNEEQSYIISMNEDFVWKTKDEVIDFATKLIE